MDDTTVTVQSLRDAVKKMVADREWEQFHSPKNLSMDIAVESAELMEKFLWLDGLQSYDALEAERKEIENELADVIIAALAFCNATSIDVSEAVARKIAEIEAKYPVEKAKGKHTKYTKLL